MRPRQWVALTCLAATPLLSGCHRSGHSDAAAAVELHFYNWASYIDPSVIEQFRRETGITVRESIYPSAEALDTVLLAGKSQYDVVVASTNSLEVLMKANALSQLNRQWLKNWSNTEPALLEKLAGFDPGNQQAVPYFWGVTGIALNAKALERASAAVPLDSWALIYEPAFARDAAKCRISVVDSPDDIIDTMLLYLGKDPNSNVPGDLDEAAKRLLKIRGSIVKISSDDQIDDLVSGETCVQITWTSTVVQARRRAKEAGIVADLRLVIPKEGTMIFMDTLAIPKDAPHPKEAHLFIDFLLRADVAARNANFVGGASPNRAAMPLIDAVLREDASVYPPAAVIATLKQFHKRPLETTRITTREWTRFRTGS